MLHKRKEQKPSSYSGLYDILIQKDHFLRQFKELVDFSFVYDMLEHTYSHDNGRGAIDPVEMFKYLILKVLYNLSDVDIVERATTDMAIKYFLDRNPEDILIDPSSLTKFRRKRLKECGINLLDTLIAKTVEIAKKEGLLKGTSLIVDSTHTTSKYSLKSKLFMII